MLTTQKERTVNVAKQVIMTDPGDQQQLKIPLNADVCIQPYSFLEPALLFSFFLEICIIFCILFSFLLA